MQHRAGLSKAAQPQGPVAAVMGLGPIFCFWLTGELMATKQELLRALAEPVVAALGCQLWGLEYLTRGRSATVRLYIDKPEGVLLEDCERVSRQFSSVLDVEDPIAGEYTLEVSSPGMDRPLFTAEQYRQYLGEKVALRLHVPVDGQRRFRGVIEAVEGEQVSVVVDDKKYELPLGSIDRANVVPRFD